MNLLRPLIVLGGLLAVWQFVVFVTNVPPYILPSPLQVATALATRFTLVASHSWVTIVEIVLGLLIGAAIGIMSAIILASAEGARRWLLPVLVVSQAVPVFALAPLLTLWLGYGLSSKVAMAVLIIYFPVTAAFYDGLRRTEPGWIELARTMNAKAFPILWRIRIPAAMPALASGLRVAASVAPIGAVVGEWVGSSRGLGYLMLHANGRMQTDLMFAALFVLCLAAVALWFAVDAILRRLVRWQPETLHQLS